MFSPTDAITEHPHVVRPFLTQLSVLFAEMDTACTAVAEYYDFQCTGCDDNCCLTLFHHHTLVEYLLLAQGFCGLDAAKQAAVSAESRAVCRKTAAAGAMNRPVRLMCPLNHDGRCILYVQRPMICRLHGVPHELHRPGGATVTGPGCKAFDSRSGGRPQRRLDRTPYYIDMARLERALQQALGVSVKIKMTVAEMLMAIGGQPI